MNLGTLPAYVSVAVHEFAHAFAARALGQRVRVVRLGEGRVLRVLRVFRTRVEIRTVWWNDAPGMMVYIARRTPWWKALGIFLAGPLASLFWCAFVVWVCLTTHALYSPLYVEAWLLISAEILGLRGCQDDVNEAAAELFTGPEVALEPTGRRS